MKISKRQLRQIIKEELSIALKEMHDPSAWIYEDPDLPNLTVDQQQDFNDCVDSNRGDFPTGERGTNKLYQRCLDDLPKELPEGFGGMFGKKLDPDVADLVDKVKAERTRFVHPDFIQDPSAYRKWQRELKNTEKLLKRGKVSPEEVKQKYGVK